MLHLLQTSQKCDGDDQVYEVAQVQYHQRWDAQAAENQSTSFHESTQAAGQLSGRGLLPQTYHHDAQLPRASLNV
ncbi:hypothetical protein PC116_g34668 [Phytophthora cactorum]|nr:hypothetical protein PC116_g34668 [Phytophthora cactorum]